jgi:hypothetical protein
MLPRRRRPKLRPLLHRARRRIERADPAEAAATFKKKAQVAEEQGMLDKAGDLHLEAARCYLQLDDIDRATTMKRRNCAGRWTPSWVLLQEKGPSPGEDEPYSGGAFPPSALRAAGPSDPTKLTGLTPIAPSAPIAVVSSRPPDKSMGTG